MIGIQSTICECYTQSEFLGFDQTLTGCLEGFYTALNQKKKETKNENFENFDKNHLMELSKRLIKSCTKYQKDFNTVLLSRYSNRNKENLEQSKDSLLAVIDSVDNKAGKYIILSELEILSGDYDNAFKSINTSIEMNPNMEMSYFVRDFSYHRKGDFKNAISDLKTLHDKTNNPDLRNLASLWILNLEQEIK
ncbi:MAG TPA: hypothetical protein EYG92_08815 [Lutibacter sp.]|nr:hypothetical protein [Lutibacter sp.]